jgi:uncharacterized protein HemX
MKTIIGALVGFAIGAGGIYLFEQGKLTNLQTSMSALETQLSEAKTSAETSAAETTKLQEAGKALEAEVADMRAKADAAAAELKSALDAKTEEVSTLQAKVAELEAALTAAKSGSGAAQ